MASLQNDRRSLPLSDADLGGSDTLPSPPQQSPSPRRMPASRIPSLPMPDVGASGSAPSPGPTPQPASTPSRTPVPHPRSGRREGSPGHERAGAHRNLNNGTVNEAALDGIQIAFDIAGFVPLVGEVFDGANVLISLARKDYEGAAFSGGAMITGYGIGATGAKWARNASNAPEAAARNADNAASGAAGGCAEWK